VDYRGHDNVSVLSEYADGLDLLYGEISMGILSVQGGIVVSSRDLER